MSTLQEIRNVLILGNVDAPEPVRRFEAVAKITWLMSIVSYLASYFGRELTTFEGINLVMNGVLMILNLFLIYFIAWTGDRWAKWVFLIFQTLGLASFLMLSSALLKANLFGFLVTLFQYELSAYSIYLLFEFDRMRIFSWLSRSRKTS